MILFLSYSGIEDNLASQEVHKKIEALEVSGGIGGGGGGGGVGGGGVGGGGGGGRGRLPACREKEGEGGDWEREKGEMEEEQKKASDKSANGVDNKRGDGGSGGRMTPLSPTKDDRLKPWREENGGDYMRCLLLFL